MAGLVVIALVAVVAILGGAIRPDSTPNANDQLLNFKNLKPGSVRQILLVRKNTPVASTPFCKNLFFGGTEKKHRSIAVHKWRFENERLVVEEYNGRNEVVEGKRIALELPDVLYPLVYGSEVEHLPGGKVRFEMLEGGITEREVPELKRQIETSQLVQRRFLLGTDNFGRDLLSRLMAGAMVSLSVGAISVLISLVIGVFLGSVAGYFRAMPPRVGWMGLLFGILAAVGAVVLVVSLQQVIQLAWALLLGVIAFLLFLWLIDRLPFSGGPQLKLPVDEIIMWVINVVWSIPTLLLVIAITLALGKGFVQVFIAVGLTMWVEVARVVRGQVLSLREKEFVEAGQALGFTPTRIIFKHILPNAMGPVIVISAANFASAILMEAGLSFLGIGTQIPMASWGGMIKTYYPYITTDLPHLAVLPGLCIVVLVLAFMLVGNGLRDALDVKAVEG